MADYKKTKTKEKEEGTPIDVLPIEGAVDKKYIPEGFDSVEDFLCDMRKQYELDVEFDRFNREAAIDDKKFAAGEQWDPIVLQQRQGLPRSEEHTSELQSLMRISYAVFCLKKK